MNAAAAQTFDGQWSIGDFHSWLLDLQTTVRSRPTKQDALAIIYPRVEALWNHADNARTIHAGPLGDALYRQIRSVADAIDTYVEFEHGISERPPSSPAQVKQLVTARSALWNDLVTGVDDLLTEVEALIGG